MCVTSGLFSVCFHRLEMVSAVLSHPHAILVCMNGATANGATANRVGLVVPAVPVREASSEQLQEWIGETFRVQHQAASVRAEYLTELRRREGRAIAETVLREDGLLPPYLVW